MSAPAAPRGYNQVSNFSPQMMNLFQMLLGGTTQGAGKGIDWLSKLASGDESTFNQLEAPSHNAFNAKLGDIGNRFANIGAVGSSGFNNATTGAASNFAQELGSNRINLQQGALDRLLNQSNSLLNMQPYSLQEKDQGFDWGGLLGGILGSLGGPALGGIGSAAGSKFGKKFFG